MKKGAETDTPDIVVDVSTVLTSTITLGTKSTLFHEARLRAKAKMKPTKEDEHLPQLEIQMAQ